MSRLTVLFWGLLFLTAGLLVSLDGWGRNGGSTPPPPPIPGKIQHIVVIFQENRTPDNLFHDSVLISRGADIASSGINSDGQTIPLAPVSLATDYDPNHSHNSFVLMYDKGKMDGADKIPVFCKPGATDCPAPNLQFAYVNPSEVAPYFQMAERYTFADRMFQTNQGPSFPAHQFIISGTSAPTATSNLFAAENPFTPGGDGTGSGGTGCTAAPGQLVALIDPTGDESQTQYPCFEHPALVDLLDSKKLTWRYYTRLHLDWT